MGASKWLTWTPGGAKTNTEASPRQGKRVEKGFDGFDGGMAEVSSITSTDVSDRAVSSPSVRPETELIQTPPNVEPSKPSLPAMTIEQVREHRLFATESSPKQAPPSDDHLSAGHPKGAQHHQTGNVCASPDCPPLPRGLKLVRYVPRTPPVKLEDGYTSITNLSKFIDSELRELYARLYSPAQIRGGHGIFVILDRLRQVGLEVEIAAADKA